MLAAVLVLCAVGSGLVGCTDDSGPPDCEDTSADGSRLAQGCLRDETLMRSIGNECRDGSTLYNVPFPDHGGVSGYSNGKLRPHVTTQDEIVKCRLG